MDCVATVLRVADDPLMRTPSMSLPAIVFSLIVFSEASTMATPMPVLPRSMRPAESVPMRFLVTVFLIASTPRMVTPIP